MNMVVFHFEAIIGVVPLVVYWKMAQISAQIGFMRKQKRIIKI